ncbi:hypothetical protein HDE_07503 [Halotydeus destructor]|nr:hypothetical protein HDE_07503 [Halotydeus destructor]
MLSSSVLSYCNKLLDDDELLRLPKTNVLNSSSAQGSFKVRYLGSAQGAKERKPLKGGISAVQKPLIALYSVVQRQFVYHRNYILSADNTFPQNLKVCNFGVIVSEDESRLNRCSSGVSSDREQPIVTKVITPLSNILLWAAVRFHSQAVPGAKRAHSAAFVPLACNEAVLDRSTFIKLLPKQHFLTSLSHPPLFVCVHRSVSTPKVLECHMFMCSSIEDAINMCSVMFTIQGQSTTVGALELPPRGMMGNYSFSESMSVSNSRSSPDSRIRSSDSSEVVLPVIRRRPQGSEFSTSTTSPPSKTRNQSQRRRYRKHIIKGPPRSSSSSHQITFNIPPSSSSSSRAHNGQLTARGNNGGRKMANHKNGNGHHVQTTAPGQQCGQLQGSQNGHSNNGSEVTSAKYKVAQLDTPVQLGRRQHQQPNGQRNQISGQDDNDAESWTWNRDQQTRNMQLHNQHHHHHNRQLIDVSHESNAVPLGFFRRKMTRFFNRYDNDGLSNST